MEIIVTPPVTGTGQKFHTTRTSHATLKRTPDASSKYTFAFILYTDIMFTLMANGSSSHHPVIRRGTYLSVNSFTSGHLAVLASSLGTVSMKQLAIILRNRRRITRPCEHENEHRPLYESGSPAVGQPLRPSPDGGVPAGPKLVQVQGPTGQYPKLSERLADY